MSTGLLDHGVVPVEFQDLLGLFPDNSRFHSFRYHERIPVVVRGDESFRYRTRRGPAHHIQEGASFVVGSGAASAAEGLLANHRAGWLVINIEVACCVSQFICSKFDCSTVCRKY